MLSCRSMLITEQHEVLVRFPSLPVAASFASGSWQIQIVSKISVVNYFIIFKAQWGSTWFSCGRYNPCGYSYYQFYFPSYYMQYFIQCGQKREQCFFQICEPDTIWKQAALAYVKDLSVPPFTPVLPVHPQTPYTLHELTTAKIKILAQLKTQL